MFGDQGSKSWKNRGFNKIGVCFYSDVAFMGSLEQGKAQQILMQEKSNLIS